MNNKKKSGIKAIIFDRDGVIIDTDTLVLESVFFGLKKIGITASKNDIPLMAGMSIDALKELLLSKWNFNFEEFRLIQKKYFYEHLDNAPYFLDTIKFIKELYSRNKVLALTTSAGIEGTTLILKKIGIFEMFKVIVAKEDCTKFKPDPEPYIITVNRLRVAPEDCIVIEDSEVGVKAAKNAKMYCVAVPNKHTKNQDFSLADKVVSSIIDIDLISI
jgi:HAD superfamily hydrolase (TIGR01509 family)